MKKKFLNKSNLISHKKKKLIIQNKNKVFSNALNEGVKRSSGEYISWLSHDDYFHLRKTELQIQYLNKKNAKICSCNFIEINKIKNIRLNRYLDAKYFDDQVLSLILNDSLHGCSLLIKKECFKNFKFNNKYKHIQDYDLWIKMSEKFLKWYILIKGFYIHLNISLRHPILKRRKYFRKIKFL